MQTTVYFGFTGPIESQSVSRICSALNTALNGGAEEVYLAFSSLGGYTSDGIFLYNHIRALPIPVTIHATGNVASVAVAVLLAAETRLSSQHVLFMIHPAAVPGTAEGMSWNRLDNLMKSALAEEQRTDDILRNRSLLPEELLTRRRFEEVHFTPEEAVKFGVVSAIDEFTLPSGAEVYQV